jgi:hypothetical protein
MINERHYQPYSPTATPLTTTELREKIKTERKLVKAIGDAHDVLSRAKTVFPLTLIPDTVTIDRTKLTIARRDFFKIAEVMSIQIEDILNIVANVGPFFGSLQITTRFFDPDKPYIIQHLWREDALKMKRILQGYIIARREGVDCSSLTTPELARELDELGKVAPEERV